MDTSFYKVEIEKTASIKGKAVEFVTKNKKKIAGATGLGAGLGLVYLASPKDTKKKIEHGVNKAAKSVVTAQANGQAQEILRDIGGLVGTGVSMKRGKSLGKAVASGGLAGMAIGDIAGAATIPTYQLYKKHKKEFGERPDAKSLATVVGANVLPTAAMWGGIHGLKHGAKHIKNTDGLIGKTIKKKGDAINKSVDNLSSGISSVGENLKNMQERYRAYSPKKPKDYNRIKKAIQAGNVKDKKQLNEYLGVINEFGAKTEAARALVEAHGGASGTTKLMLKDLGLAAKGAGKTMGAFAPIAVAGEVAAIPTYFATPQNVIDAKKKKMKQDEK